MWFAAERATVSVNDRVPGFIAHLLLLFFFLTIKYLFYCYFLCSLGCLGLVQGKVTKVYQPFQAKFHGVRGSEGTPEVTKHHDSLEKWLNCRSLSSTHTYKIRTSGGRA